MYEKEILKDIINERRKKKIREIQMNKRENKINEE